MRDVVVPVAVLPQTEDVQAIINGKQGLQYAGESVRSVSSCSQRAVGDGTVPDVAGVWLGCRWRLCGVLHKPTRTGR